LTESVTDKQTNTHTRARTHTHTGISVHASHSPVIRLTWRRLLRWSADVCLELCNSFRSRFL